MLLVLMRTQMIAQRQSKLQILLFCLCLCFLVLPVNGKAEPLAEVDGAAITSEELEKALGAPLMKLQEQIYTMKRRKLDAMISDSLLAKEAERRGLSVQALLDTEVTSKVSLVTEQEIENFYRANKGRMQGEEAQVREAIRSQLQNQKISAQREALLFKLRAGAKVSVYLKPPPIQRLAVRTDGAPFKGGEIAPVTIVEFSDFHCPFCKQVLSTLAEIEAQYGDKVKIAFRDFPIDQLHPGSRKGHEAARCANEQGKFWAYHDKLFANAPRASEADLKSYAKEVGLDVVSFESCISAGKYRAAVQKDFDEGRTLGVSSTPTFFVNGRLISGAQPIGKFLEAIDDELARAQ
jgi:protein-disulfide isomerase